MLWLQHQGDYYYYYFLISLVVEHACLSTKYNRGQIYRLYTVDSIQLILWLYRLYIV